MARIQSHVGSLSRPRTGSQPLLVARTRRDRRGVMSLGETFARAARACGRSDGWGEADAASQAQGVTLKPRLAGHKLLGRAQKVTLNAK